MTGRHDAVSEVDLHAYLDGELAADRRCQVEAHLASHPEDAARLESYRAQRAYLAEVIGPAIDRRLAAAPAPPVRRPRRWRLPAAAIAASLLLLAIGAGGGWLARGWHAGEAAGLAALADDALAAHKVYTVEVRHPVEVAASEEQHLVGWLSRRLGAPLAAPHLADAGFELVGGRLLPAAVGPAAQFMYQNAEGDRLTLYCRPTGDRRETSFRFARSGDAAAFYWKEDGLGWAVTGDIGRDALLAVAREIYRQLGG